MKKLNTIIIIVLLLIALGSVGLVLYVEISKRFETTAQTEQVQQRPDPCAVETCSRPAKPRSYFCGKHSH